MPREQAAAARRPAPRVDAAAAGPSSSSNDGLSPTAAGQRAAPTISPTALLATSGGRGASPARRKGVLKRPAGPRAARGKRRRVAFKSVEIREMYIQVGDSGVPCDGGPPIGISPRLKRTLTHSLDCFELERETGRRLKTSVGSPLAKRLGRERFAREGRVPPDVRRRMLARALAADHHITQAEESARRIQQSRDDTNRLPSLPDDLVAGATIADDLAAWSGDGGLADRLGGPLFADDPDHGEDEELLFLDGLRVGCVAAGPLKRAVLAADPEAADPHAVTPSGVILTQAAPGDCACAAAHRLARRAAPWLARAPLRFEAPPAAYGVADLF